MRSRITDQPNGSLTMEERRQLATLLLKAGYAVVIGKKKTLSGTGKSTTVPYVEYWKDGEGQ